MTHETVSYEEVFQWTKFLAFEINVKLVFHEMPWKKNFTVYLSLNRAQMFSFLLEHRFVWRPRFKKKFDRRWLDQKMCLKGI